MKQWMVGAMVAGLALAGHAVAGEGCAHAGADGAKACTWNKSAAAGKSCGEMKAGECRGCDELAASGKALRATGANFEYVKTKSGYIVLATTTGAENIAALRKANHERWTGFLAHVNAKDKPCKSCAGLAAGLKSGAFSIEEVETANGVMTVMTASGDDAVAALKASCGAYCGMKTAEVSVKDPKTATN